MSGNSFLVDTNIFIYLLNGNERIADILQGKNIYCSFVTELELKSSKKYTLTEEKIITGILKETHILDINSQIKINTILFRKKYGLKLPDAIIAATSTFINTFNYGR